MKGIWVVKAGGEIFQKGGVSLDRFLAGMVRLARRYPLVFVHGGGPQLTDALQKRKSPVRFVKGLRVTSPGEMRLVERILSGEINKEITGRLIRWGGLAVGISGRDGRLLEARVLPGMGCTGRAVRSRPAFLLALLREKCLPVVSPVCAGSRGEALNVNADEAALCLAMGVKAARLIFLTNVPGVYGPDGIPLSRLTSREAGRLLVRRVIQGGMIPKVRSAVAGVRKGVGEVWIAKVGEDLEALEGTRIHG